MLKAYLYGLLSALLDDEAAANLAAQEAASYVVPSEAFSSGLFQGIRARVLLRRGRAADTTAALSLLQARIESPLERVIASRFFSRAPDRFLKGELLLAKGEMAKADSVFSALLEGFDATYAAPANLRLAEIRDALGDTLGATRHYARFTQLWEAADPEFQPLIERAESRLQALRRN